jgi:hypothetical protein
LWVYGAIGAVFGGLLLLIVVLLVVCVCRRRRQRCRPSLTESPMAVAPIQSWSSPSPAQDVAVPAIVNATDEPIASGGNRLRLDCRRELLSL